MVTFRRQHPKWDQNPWFVLETATILSTFAYVRVTPSPPPPRLFNISRLWPFHRRLHRVKLVIAWIWPKYSISYRRNALYWINSCTNVYIYRKSPVIMQVSFPESTKVPAHTGLTVLDRFPKEKKKTLKVTKLSSCLNFWKTQAVIKCFEDQLSIELRIIRRPSNDVSPCLPCIRRLNPQYDRQSKRWCPSKTIR